MPSSARIGSNGPAFAGVFRFHIPPAQEHEHAQKGKNQSRDKKPYMPGGPAFTAHGIRGGSAVFRLFRGQGGAAWRGNGRSGVSFLLRIFVVDLLGPGVVGP